MELRGKQRLSSVRLTSAHSYILLRTSTQWTSFRGERKHPQKSRAFLMHALDNERLETHEQQISIDRYDVPWAADRKWRVLNEASHRAILLNCDGASVNHSRQEPDVDAFLFGSTALCRNGAKFHSHPPLINDKLNLFVGFLRWNHDRNNHLRANAIWA